MRRLITILGVALAATALPRGVPLMSESREPTDDDAAVRQVYDRWAKAFRAHNLDSIMAVYAPGSELVAYDIVPPLQFVGRDAYRKDYETFLAQYTGPIETEFRDLQVVTSNRVAFIHCLERIEGTLTTGQHSQVWVRATSGLRKINGRWLIVHDHISVPADMETGYAALNLKP